MFGRKKEERRRGNAGSGLSQFGLLDLPNVNDYGNVDMMGGVDDDDDDGDLEAELLALTSGKSPSRPKRVRPPPPANLDAMVAESMQDIPSDEELSGDENDPALMEELSALNDGEADEREPEPEPVPQSKPPPPVSVGSGSSLVSTLEERLKMYQEAEKNAKTAGESSRARRFGRGVKTLGDLLKQARAGRVVNEEDIPPPVITTAGKKPPEPQPASPPAAEDVPIPTPSRPAPPPPVRDRPPAVPPRPARGVPLPGLVSGPSAPSPPEPSSSPTDQSETLSLLKGRQNQYKTAALLAKKAGDSNLAIQYVRVAKQFDLVIGALEEGQPVDLSAMPPPPSQFTASIPTSSGGQKEENEKQRATEERPAVASEEPAPSDGAPTEEAPEDIYSAPPAPTSVMEALEQRLNKYRNVEQAARDEGNSSKARRMGRIVKQYENAIKLHRAGKPIPIEDLPTPPGFGPIPVEGGESTPPAASPSEDPTVSPSVATPTPVPRLPRPREAPTPPAPAAAAAATPPKPSGSTTPILPQKINVRKTPQSRQEKQLAFLIARQKEFREAALQAKQKGEVNQAKEYLRLAKGFDPLIEASHSGLPVDMTTVPIPPDTKVVLESDFDFVTIDDCVPGSDAEIFDKLEEDLFKQAKMCLTTRDHFKAIGDVASANRFEHLALNSKKDLDAVRCAHKRSEPLPKFHYETRSFSIVQCCTDLTDNDLELTIVQGINYSVANPKDVDTYVKFEFPYPSEDTPKDRTALVKDTNNPEYNATFNLTIHRNSRACQRIFKRQGIKLEVWSRGLCLRSLLCCQPASVKSRGFFRSDALIGTATVKMLPLETKCIIHDSFDLMDGRKPVGGKLEVKVRIRNPILTKQVEQMKEKWLVIDCFQ